MITSKIYSLFVLSLVLGICEIFAPNGKIKSYISYLFALVSLCVLFSPFVSLLGKIPDFCRTVSEIADSEISGDYSICEESQSYGLLIQSGKEAIEKHTSELIFTRFGIISDDAVIEAILDCSDIGNIQLVGMIVTVNEKYKSEIDVIEKYLSAYYGIGVTVL